TQKVVFVNKELNTRMAGLLRLPDGFDLSKDYPAIVLTGPMLSVKEQAQSVYAERLTESGYVTLVFDGTYFGESEGMPRGQELPEVKESDIESAVDYLCSLPYVDKDRIGGLGICGSGSYMSVAGVKEPRIKAVTAIVPAISDISTSPMMGFFKPKEEVKAAKESYDKGEGGLMYLNFMPRAFDEGAAYYYSARGTHPRWSNQVVAWSQLELVKYNVTNIMKEMQKPYCVITAENAWSKPSSEEIFNAVPTETKELHVIPEASHFDMYDLAPFVSEAFEYIIPFFGKNL
ncbi:MAG: alpha/beta hydrolase, partial [Clostridiales bacterium]|nr:alpha/beta hydrolase [Clostridiales bacterium]